MKPFHPPLPAPVRPVPLKIEILTPEVTAAKNALGEHYAYFAMTDQDYLTLAAWLQDVLRYVRQLNSVVEYYRHER